MRFDWQAVAVALIVATAFLYAARRALSRLRSFRAKGGASSSCATGCGKCGEEELDAPLRQAGPPLTQLGRSKGAGGRRD